MSPAQQFRLPDLFAGCPLEDRVNPHYQEASAESRAWVYSFHVFSGRTQTEFVETHLELLASHIFWYADFEQFRTVCDFINLYTVFDDITDGQSGEEAHSTSFNFVQAMKDPYWGDDSVIARMTREFRTRIGRLVGPNNLLRLIDVWEKAAYATTREAELRERGELLSLDGYTRHRRYGSGTLICIALIEYAFGIDLPDVIYENPAVLKAYFAACDHSCYVNDVCSYNREQSKGQGGNNVVTLLMKERNMSLQEACDYVGTRSQHFVDDYISARDEIGETLGSDVSQLIQGMGSFMIGNLTWCFETPRYFGPEHDEVRRTLTVVLLPLEAASEVGS